MDRDRITATSLCSGGVPFVPAFTYFGVSPTGYSVVTGSLPGASDIVSAIAALHVEAENYRQFLLLIFLCRRRCPWATLVRYFGKKRSSGRCTKLTGKRWLD
jgi:hypothetical protein